MAEKNSKLKFDDYSRRLSIQEKDKRESFCKLHNLTESKMYKILSTIPYNYTDKRAEQDNLRLIAWRDFGAVFENITFTRK